MPAFGNNGIPHKWSPPSETAVYEGRVADGMAGHGNGSVENGLPPNGIFLLSTSPVPRIRRIPSVVHLTQDCRPLSPSPPEHDRLPVVSASFLLLFGFGVVQKAVVAVFNLFFKRLLTVVTFWLSGWLWILSKCTLLPIAVFKHLWSSFPGKKLRKRVVLISGGSTVQALYLARNFYSAGARVVVCEVEGRFGLARFSTAVSKFYTVPKPETSRAVEYVNALCALVEKEKVSYYIPVSATNEALYDALAKPQLEVLNCVVFCPTLKEVLFFDDLYEVLTRCRSLGLATPSHHHVTCRNDVLRLYDSGLLRSARHFMANVGPSAIGNRLHYQVPPFLQDFRTTHEISHQRPWLVVQDVKGDHYVTCTTIKESIVVGNVTCRLESDRRGLVPVDKEEIALWIQNFFAKLNYRPISGHFSFRFAIPTSSSTIVPLGCKVGVSLPYICFTAVHPRIVWKPCKHFSKQSSGPLVARTPRYWMHDAVLSALRHPSVDALTKLVGTVLDKREAIFVYWDPLPYCAYYHLQLPFAKLFAFLRIKREQTTTFFDPPGRRTETSPAA